MSPQGWYTSGCLVAGAFGAAVGALLTAGVYEKKLREAQTVNIYNTYPVNERLSGEDFDGDTEMSVGAPNTVTFVPNVAEILGGESVEVVDKPIDEVEPEKTNDYVSTLEAANNDSLGAIVYIDEAQYFEEDGRYKGQITMLLGEDEPYFLQGGVPLSDWQDRIGENILNDFFVLIGPDPEKSLYVRNHERDEDYEVIRALP